MEQVTEYPDHSLQALSSVGLAEPFQNSNQWECDVLLCLERGSLVLELPKREMKIQRGSLVMISSETHQHIRRWRTQGAKMLMIYFKQSVVMEDSSTVEKALYLRSFGYLQKKEPHVISVHADQQLAIIGLIRHIQKLSATEGTVATLEMKVYLKAVLLLLGQQLPSAISTINLPPLIEDRRAFLRLQPLLKYLNTYYMESISTEYAAKILNMSTSHFMRCFRNMTGSAFVPYLNRIRIQKSQELMQKTDLSLAEIAESVGFCDQSYFASNFRKIVGCSPREFRSTL